MPSLRRSGDERNRPLTSDRRWLGGLAALLVLVTVGVMATAIVGSSVQTGVRAFVGGEGSWSKAQKNAVIHLQRFLATGDTADWDTYRRRSRSPMATAGRASSLRSQPRT